jgi:phosphoribosyl 1,2-cyclic phosphate phosphodiesterase
LKVTFLGTGTSQGVPIIGCNCDVCSSTDTRDKRLRTSIFIETEEAKVVIDTGPDFRQQMLANSISDVDAVVYTHAHKDHTAGLDDIRPINFLHEKDMDIYASDSVEEALRREYMYIFDERFDYPGIPRVNMHRITDEPFSINGLEITPIKVLHYKLPVFGFRIGDFTYITDANQIPDSERSKIEGSKVMVLNALRQESHISHFTLKEAIEEIQSFNVDQGYLIHLSHQMGRHAEVEAELPDNIALAFDGLNILL